MGGAMRLKPKHYPRLFLGVLLAFVLAGVTGCGAQQNTAAPEPEKQEATQQETTQQEASEDERQAAYDDALEGNGVVSTFIGEEFYDGTVKSQEDALKAVQSVYNRIGADDTTTLEITAVRPTEDGVTYYVFSQRAGDVLVHGASVKLIVNKDGKAIGLVSSILPKVKAPDLTAWGATQEKAEEAVSTALKEDGVKGANIVSDASEQTVIPLSDNATDRYRYAWVVYTNNYLDNAEMGYLAHYVSEDGDYLYAIPVVEPNNKEALDGNTITFKFDAYEEAESTFDTTLHDGKTKTIKVPVLKDKQDGTIVLGDARRKILCADYADYRYNEKLSVCASKENSFNNFDLLAYDTFIRVWDFFDGIGWTGPDGEGTPTLLLMNYVDTNGEQKDQAFYTGRQNGYQVFCFNRVNPDGENTDIIAHEFTHCLTETTMTSNLYRNDYGAINEGMSDVMGNLVEMLIDDKPDIAWELGAGSGVENTLRSMKDPHAHQQPEFVGDTYYVPAVAQGTENNDNGGVHINSSLLNIVSYKLDQAGMQPNDQQFFWMNVALAMTPRTDYPMMAELLPWCMEHSGFSQYVEPLKKAIADAKYTQTTVKAEPAEGCGIVTLDVADQKLVQEGAVTLALVSATGQGEIVSWPPIGSTVVTINVPAGDYYAVLSKGADNSDATRSACVGKDADRHWIQVEQSDNSWVTDENAIHVEAGKTVTLPSLAS